MSLGAYVPELRMDLADLMAHNPRSLVTISGMIVGVGAMIVILGLSAGSREDVLRDVDALGRDSVIVEAREAATPVEFERRRQVSPGLTYGDASAVRRVAPGISMLTARKKVPLARVLPKPSRGAPLLMGVEPVFGRIRRLRLQEGRFFNDEDEELSSPVCVLGEDAKASLLGFDPAVGKYIKLNDVWLQVIGVLARQPNAEAGVAGIEEADGNSVILAPLTTVTRRFEESGGSLRDEIDGMYARVSGDPASAARTAAAVLLSRHHGLRDFTVVAPAAMLEDRKRAQAPVFAVMLLVTGISLLAGGIGVMNIMLAGVIERRREIGIRRTVGARQLDIARQFLAEAVVIAMAGGAAGVLLGLVALRVLAAAGWATSMAGTAMALALAVAGGVGLAFGIYPARQAARVDPAQAIGYK